MVKSSFDIRSALGEYESSVGARGGRLAVTITQGRLSGLGLTAKCMQWYIVGLTLFLFISGILIIATGQYAKNSSTIVAAAGSTFIATVMVMGAFLFLVGLVGLCGARTETRLCLMIFTGLLGLLFIVLLIIGSYTVAQVTEGKLYSLIYDTWINLPSDTLSGLQESYTCCCPNIPPANSKAPKTCSGDTEFSITTLYNQGDGNVECAGTYCPTDASGCILPLAASQSCIALIVPDVQRDYYAFGVVGILLSFACLSGIVGGCCLMGGIQVAEEKKAKEAKNAKRKAKGLPIEDD